MKRIVWGAALLCACLCALLGPIVWLSLENRAEPLSTVQAIRVGTAMPTVIDVNGIEWHVQFMRFKDPGLQGLTRCEKRVIELKEDGVRSREALLHELLHAQVCHYVEKDHDFEPDNLYYNSTDNEKHEGIYNIAAVVSQLLARNPELAQWEAEGYVSLGKVDVK